MTDHNVIKALECCTLGDCFPCAYGNIGVGCRDKMNADALALINRQKAEIERLQAVHADMTESLRLASEANKDMSVELDAMRGVANSYKMHYETAKSEAIKEFAERLKANMSNIAVMEYGGNIYFCVGYDLIDTLVKEMTEDNNESQNT